jgi:hypothetical protein
MLRALGRIVVQLALVGPLVFFYPFLLFATGHTAYDLFARPGSIGAFNLIFVAGGLGLTGLYASILLPLSWLRRRALRWTVTAFMAFGIVLAIVFLAIGGDTSSGLGENALWAAWVTAGPLIVALWNLRRMWRRETNANQEPTAGARPA